jgi:hypothetical protein
LTEEAEKRYIITVNSGFEIVTTIFVKSLLPSLFQREEFPALEKSIRPDHGRGKGRFYLSMLIQLILLIIQKRRERYGNQGRD